MKYNVGDRVRIKSLDWYNKNEDNYGAIYAGNGFCFWKNMVRHCGEIMKITIVKVDPEDSNKGYYFMENSKERWTDEMIEGLAEEEVGLVDNLSSRWVNEFSLPDGYIFKDENGNEILTSKIILEKKKKEVTYPKTYEECCEIIHSDPKFYVDTHLYSGILEALYKLLICRNAYWKIYGEEMGLGKPWEPDWEDDTTHKFIIHTIKDKIHCGVSLIKNHLLAFPTEEMRDAFYENFKDLIESCKELL